MPSFTPDRLNGFVHRDCSHARKLIRRTHAELDPEAFFEEVGVVQMHGAGWLSRGLLALHSAVELLLLQAGGWVAHANFTREDHGRDVGDSPADVMDGQNHIVNENLVIFINLPAVSDVPRRQ